MPLLAAFVWNAVLSVGPAAGLQSEAAILALETRRFAAMIAADVRTLDTMLADDLSYTHSTGRVETKLQFLDALRTGQLKYKSIDRSDVRVKLYGETAVVTGEAHLHVEAAGNALDLPVRFLDVYVKAPSGWQMVAWQSTKLAQP
jgi:ketosteroid isomerase-like protein